MAREELLQDLLEQLAAQACAAWTPPPRQAPDGENDDYWRYEWIEATRLRVGCALSEQPELAVELSELILEAVLLEQSTTDQLIFPLVDAIGRRTVLQRLIEAVGTPPIRRQLNAANAAYFVWCWDPLPLRRAPNAARAEGIGSAAEFREFLRRRRDDFQERPVDKVDDMWPRFWRACLTVFVTCDDDVRSQLQTAFPLSARCYPSADASLLAAAERIARDNPTRYARLLNGSTGYGHSI